MKHIDKMSFYLGLDDETLSLGNKPDQNVFPRHLLSILQTAFIFVMGQTRGLITEWLFCRRFVSSLYCIGIFVKFDVPL